MDDDQPDDQSEDVAQDRADDPIEDQAEDQPAAPDPTSEPASEPAEAPSGEDADFWSPAAAGDARTVTLTTTQIGLIGGIVAVVVVALLIGIVVAAGGSDDSPSADKRDPSSEAAPDGATTTTIKRSLPREIGGRPAGFGERGDKAPTTTSAAPGVYLWNDFDGWHLWVVRGQGADAISGTITSSADVLKADPAAAAEANGVVSIDGKAIQFDFTAATAPVVGIDFNPGYRVESVTVVATDAGAPLAADLFRVGAKAVSKAVPYTAALTATP